MIDAAAILPVVSLVFSIGTLGIAIGVFQTRMARAEADINRIGSKIDKETAELKADHIRPLEARLVESEADQRNLAEIMCRMEATLEAIKDRLSGLERKLEAR
jgi:uncharacterized protein (DUF2342 family)